MNLLNLIITDYFADCHFSLEPVHQHTASCAIFFTLTFPAADCILSRLDACPKVFAPFTCNRRRKYLRKFSSLPTVVFRFDCGMIQPVGVRYSH